MRGKSGREDSKVVEMERQGIGRRRYTCPGGFEPNTAPSARHTHQGNLQELRVYFPQRYTLEDLKQHAVNKLF